MINRNLFWKFLTPIRTLSIGFTVFSLIGSVILSLPISTLSGEYTSFVDALFTAMSAITTTGLGVVDTVSHYNIFGQLVIMILFQVGGLGYMIFISLFVLSYAGKLSITTRMLLRESINFPSTVDIIRFTKAIIYTTFIIEIIGAIGLAIYWSKFFSLGDAIYSGLFHSISAFTTAGFSIYSDSFMAYKGSIVFNIIVIALMVLGSLGFFVLYDVSFYIRRKTKKLTTHSKLVIALMFFLILISALLIFLVEGNNHVSSIKDKIITALFQATTASTTAGFNTINIGEMADNSLFNLIIIMFIGAGPGGTAGGIKLTTFGVLLISLFEQLTGRKNVAILKRKISEGTIQRAIAIFLVAILWLTTSMIALTFTEHQSFIKILFEVASALGTVGLSAGISADLTVIGKIVIIITMFIGRVGPLGIALSVMVKKKVTSYDYPEDDILVG